MDIMQITLENLLTNPFIKRREVDGDYFFSYEDINRIFEDGFKYTPHVVLKWRDESNFTSSGKFINYKEIQEQVDHLKNTPSFEEHARKFFGFDKKK